MKKFINSPLMMIPKKNVIKLPTPPNISIFWNMGSILGMCMMIQLISGLILTMHYTANLNYSFFSVIHIMQDMNYGWLIRLIHMNGASMFFMCVYLHIGRGMYFSSYKLKSVWLIGIIILLTMMGTAFMGYVLPWGQMSFWGATVSIDLMSALPFIGKMMVEWLWGGFSVDNPTLNRFYTFHFLLPFVLMMMIIMHLFFLHQTGSNNPLGTNSKIYMIKFHMYFTIKDIIGFIIVMYMLLFISLQYPYMMGDSENFIMANSMITPIHIQPEWYFLFAYTILRSIPNKLGGVIALIMSILILMIKPYINKSNFQSTTFYPPNQLFFWMFTTNIMLLTWLGSQPVEAPFIMMSQILTINHFMYFFFSPLIKINWDKMIK